MRQNCVARCASMPSPEMSERAHRRSALLFAHAHRGTGNAGCEMGRMGPFGCRRRSETGVPNCRAELVVLYFTSRLRCERVPGNRRAQKHALSWDYLVPPRGLEPRTNGLKVRCSTVELEGRDRLKRWKKTLPRFGPEPGGRGYRLGPVWPAADLMSGRVRW